MKRECDYRTHCTRLGDHDPADAQLMIISQPKSSFAITYAYANILRLHSRSLTIISSVKAIVTDLMHAIMREFAEVRPIFANGLETEER